MAKQVHIRLDDEVYDDLLDYSVNMRLSIQDSIGSAIKQMLVKAKEEHLVMKEQHTFIDLFAGIGGMHIAYESAGARCVYANEWNKYSQQTYYANFGIQPDGDICDIRTAYFCGYHR